ncbi:MAG: DUF5320 domain-containing protein [Bacteroidales bacterium]|nr:DUF5320 domain-containing protein [Bacteroidales bacterium]
MPRGDKTGPAGDGPLTGRRMGDCAGSDYQGFINWGGGYGRGFRGGFGHGRGSGLRFGKGYGHYYQGSVPGVSEKTLIENEIKILKDQLSSLEDRLSKIGEE